MKELTEANAWLKVSKLFFNKESKFTQEGLCDCVDKLSNAGIISNDTYGRMTDRIHRYVDYNTFAYSTETEWDNDSSHDARLARSMAALWLMEEAIEELQLVDYLISAGYTVS